MQHHSLPDPWEETTTKSPTPTEFTVRPTGEPIEFKVKPDGEFNFKGVPDDNVIRQIITATDYNRAATRRQELEITKQAKNIDLLSLGVLGSSILVSIICLFISLHNKQQQPQGSVNNGEFFRGTYCR
jgi:hypothetical protein